MLTPFLKYVSEGRIVRRQSDASRHTFPEIQEKIYLSLLSLALLKNFKETHNFTKLYANNTLNYGSFDRVRGSANDLHNMLSIVAGDPEITKKLANKNQAQALRQRHSVPELAVRRFLRTFEDSYKFFAQIETALAISNAEYKNLRRAISDYKNLGDRRKKIVARRMLHIIRSKLPGTDIQRKVQEWAKSIN
jgi:hypothetical protein